MPTREDAVTHPAFSPRASFGAPAVSGREDVPHVAGYLARMSVAPGEPLDVHVATRSAAPCFVDLYRVSGCVGAGFDPRLDHVERLGSVKPLRYAHTPAGAPQPLAPGACDSDGCGWPAQRLLDAVPDSWASGVYVLQFTAAAEPTGRLGRVGEDAVLIVRPRAPRQPRLLQVGVATWAAYHVWENRSLYGGLDAQRGWHHELRAHRVSLHRPGTGLGLFNQSTWGPGKAAYLWKLLQWAGEEGIAFDVCSGLDVATGRIDLAPYRLLVTVGHDEYWSGPQRDRVEAFVAGGGNAAFFGGNLAYWQVRVEDDGAAVVCHKRQPSGVASLATDGEPLDPRYRDPQLHPQHDNSEVTVEFDSPPLWRSTTQLTGVTMRNDEALRRADPRRDDLVFCGAAWWWEDLGGPSRPAKGFTVNRPDHWAFAGLDLERGAEFGAPQRIVGFECDGLDVVFDGEGGCRPSGRDGAPEGIEVLAYADCGAWSQVDFGATPPRATPGVRANEATSGGVVTVVERRHPSGGRVLTAPTTDWAFALVPSLDYTDYRRPHPPVNPPCPVARHVTRTAIEQLSRPG